MERTSMRVMEPISDKEVMAMKGAIALNLPQHEIDAAKKVMLTYIDLKWKGQDVKLAREKETGKYVILDHKNNPLASKPTFWSWLSMFFSWVTPDSGPKSFQIINDHHIDRPHRFDHHFMGQAEIDKFVRCSLASAMAAGEIPTPAFSKADPTKVRSLYKKKIKRENAAKNRENFYCINQLLKDTKLQTPERLKRNHLLIDKLMETYKIQDDQARNIITLACKHRGNDSPSALLSRLDEQVSRIKPEDIRERGLYRSLCDQLQGKRVSRS